MPCPCIGRSANPRTNRTRPRFIENRCSAHSDSATDGDRRMMPSAGVAVMPASACGRYGPSDGSLLPLCTALRAALAHHTAVGLPVRVPSGYCIEYPLSTCAVRYFFSAVPNFFFASAYWCCRARSSVYRTPNSRAPNRTAAPTFAESLLQALFAVRAARRVAVEPISTPDPSGSTGEGDRRAPQG